MVSACDLTRVQLDALSVLAERHRTGADIIRELEAQYDSAPHPSTVYHHLDSLVDDDLVRKEESGGSGRANRYRITDAGEGVVREYVAALAVRVQTGEFHPG